MNHRLRRDGIRMLLNRENERRLEEVAFNSSIKATEAYPPNKSGGTSLISSIACLMALRGG
jgi:hypothetical protein